MWLQAFPVTQNIKLIADIFDDEDQLQEDFLRYAPPLKTMLLTVLTSASQPLVPTLSVP